MKSKGEALVLLLLLASIGLARKKYAGWTDDDMRAFLDAIKRTGVPPEAASSITCAGLDRSTSEASSHPPPCLPPLP